MKAIYAVFAGSVRSRYKGLARYIAGPGVIKKAGIF